MYRFEFVIGLNEQFAFLYTLEPLRRLFISDTLSKGL